MNKPPTISVPSTASSSNTQGGINFFEAPGSQNTSNTGTQNAQRQQPGLLGPAQGNQGGKSSGIIGPGPINPPTTNPGTGNQSGNQGGNPLQRGPLPQNPQRQEALANMFGFKKS